MMINRMSDFPKKELVVADILRVTSGKNNLVVSNGKRVVFSGKVIQLNDLVHNEFPVSDQVREETLNLYVQNIDMINDCLIIYGYDKGEGK